MASSKRGDVVRGAGEGKRSGDPEMGAKLDAVARAIGHLLESHMFDGATIGIALQIDRARVSNLRNGLIPLREEYLPRLIAHFGLEGKLEADAWRLPLGQFEAELRARKIGIHAGNPLARARQELFDLADPKRLTGGRCSIDIYTVVASRRAGGLGLPPEERNAIPQFKERDRVRLRVSVPGAGYLVILDEQMGIETTCLMPSMFAPTAATADQRVIVPPALGDPLTDAFHVARPEGLHRLFAVWTKHELPLPWAKPDYADEPPLVLTEDQLIAFSQRVGALAGNDAEHLAVATADYRVV